MSPLARVATLAAVTIGTAVAVAAPAAAQPSAPESPSTETSTPTGAATSPSDTSSPSPSGSVSGSASATASGSAVASAQDAQFLRQAHQTNLAEIAAGHLAQQKGNSQTVKNLGKTFVTDHTKLDQQLKPVAQTLGVSLPNAPNAHQQAVANRLKGTSGSSFDTLFVTTQLAGHTQSMQAGQTEIEKGSNPQAVKVARDSAPVIASHHQALESAAHQLGIQLSATPLPTASPTLPFSPQPGMHS